MSGQLAHPGQNQWSVVRCKVVFVFPILVLQREFVTSHLGSHRYHERRSSGRKTASPALVVRGTVRLIAAVATRLRRYTARELAPADTEEWRTLRTELEECRRTRTLQRRFRRDPERYLTQLEQQLVKLTLPP